MTKTKIKVNHENNFRRGHIHPIDFLIISIFMPLIVAGIVYLILGMEPLTRRAKLIKFCETNSYSAYAYDQYGHYVCVHRNKPTRKVHIGSDGEFYFENKL